MLNYCLSALFHAEPANNDFIKFILFCFVFLLFKVDSSVLPVHYLFKLC